MTSQMIGAVATVLLLTLLLVGTMGLIVYVTFIRVKTRYASMRESGAVTGSRTDIVFSVVVLTIWLLLCLGALAWWGRWPLRAYLLHRLWFSLLFFAVSGYGVLMVALIFRKAAHDLRAAYREGKRLRAQARHERPRT